MDLRAKRISGELKWKNCLKVVKNILPDRILAYMLKQRTETFLFGSKAYQVIVSAAFGIGNRDVDPVRENLPTVYEVTGGKDRIV